MLPDFLFPEQVVSANGEGPPLTITPFAGKTLQVTLGITDIVEQESLDVAVYGSGDGATWTPKPLLAFPQKFYKGVSTLLLDLSPTPELQQLKVKYKTNRWGHWTEGPKFKFYVFVEPLA